MNVLIIPSWYPAEKDEVFGSFFREQSIAEAKDGNFVVVLNGTFAPCSEIMTEKCLKLVVQEDSGVRVYRKMIPSFGYSHVVPLFIGMFRLRIGELLAAFQKDYPQLRIDIIHAHSCYPAGVIACEIGKKLNVPVVITEHRSTYLGNPISKKQIEVLNKCIQGCNRFLCVSEALKKNIIRNLFPSDKFTVLPNIVSNAFYYKSEKKKNKDDFVFISVGGLIPRKRHLQLVRCFFEAFSKTKSVKLLIAGEGNERGQLEEFISSHKCYNQIELLGQIKREEVVEYLQNSEVFVLPSAYETFGVAYIEALACGVPVIAARNGGANEIINEKNGILVDVDDDEQLKWALLNMYYNSKSYDPKTIAESARNLYSEDTIINHLQTIYTEAISEY